MEKSFFLILLIYIIWYIQNTESYYDIGRYK